jgi:5-methylcytosine-specific restriction endonuclease McrA
MLSPRVKDIKGKRFGRLLVLRYLYLKRGKAYWLCLCDCGNKVIVDGGHLKSGHTKSCGCLNIDKIRERSRAKLKGQRFGRLVVIKFSHVKNGRTYWKCKCDCGNIAIVVANKLKSGHIKSCGCLRRETMSKRIGRANPNWKNSATSKNQLIRNSIKYKNWRDKVFERDNYTCQMCGKRGGKLQAHHKFPFSKFPMLRFEVRNGITLCEECHNRIKWEEIHFK